MTADARPLRRDAAHNREKLVAAAGQVFSERGLDAAMEEIARRAGVSIGTLYNHFASREMLFDEILPQRIAGLATAADEALAEADAWAGFELYLTRIFELQASDRGISDAMTQQYPNAALLTEACQVGYARATEVIGRAIDSGDLREDFALSDLACLIWALSRVIRGTVDVAPDAWRRYLGFQLDGLRAQAARPLPTPPMSGEQVAAAMGGA